jgi:hypothetical protein
MKRALDAQAAAAEVMMHRMTMMWFAPSDATTQKESVKMVAEKQAAAAEAAMAFSMSMAAETWKFWSRAAFGQVATDPVQKAVKASLRKAAAPVTKRVRTNRRRLSR